uniref:HAT C-terminal dimerisation domain-containing protein n=1 Tax=Lactuca sativa TaxID=4236 RepID=A0A9R1XN13_LACSA|nr:hypothetical protein LSAT_V11C400226390 [Lactuca sativa]
MKAFERIAKNADEERVLLEQFASFHMKKGIYSMAATQMDAVTMEPIDWWLSYGSKTPELADVAKKVLSQPISSSSAERNWSSYSYIQNVKRNCLNCKTANKLVFIHSNLRLQSRFFEEYNQALTKSGTLILITQTWKAIELELHIGTYLILFYQFNILERFIDWRNESVLRRSFQFEHGMNSSSPRADSTSRARVFPIITQLVIRRVEEQLSESEGN